MKSEVCLMTGSRLAYQTEAIFLHLEFNSSLLAVDCVVQ